MTVPNARTGGPGERRLFDGDAAVETVAVRIGGPAPEGRPVALDESAPLADRLRAVLAAPSDDLLERFASEIEWPAALFDYQIDGVRVLLERDRVLLADDMGLGKTIQVAAALRILHRARKIRAALLVVPASLREQWRRELKVWAPELRVMVVDGSQADRSWKWTAEKDVFIVSYGTLRSDVTENPQCPPRRRVWDVMILDEAQKIKNPALDTSLSCKRLERRRSWALTGTPVENSLGDLASILQFVDRVHGEPPPAAMKGEALLARHRELQLRRRKRDVLTQLPPKQEIVLTIPLSPGQQRAYERAEREGVFALEQKGAELRIQHVLELIMRLKQICNVCATSGESAKLDDIRDRMRTLTAEGYRALIFTQFVDATFGVAAVARALAEFDPLEFTGELDGEERQRVIDRFKGSPEHRALVLSLKAGGVGLNLQEASYVFHFDRWWNPAVERQAEDRSHRLGQTEPVTVYKYVTIGTIEERIHQIVSGKQAMFDEVVDEVSMEVGGPLDNDEIFGLFNLAVPPAARASRKIDPVGSTGTIAWVADGEPLESSEEPDESLARGDGLDGYPPT